MRSSLNWNPSPVAAKLEDQPPADIADKVASGPSSRPVRFRPNPDSSVSETDEASSRTADLSETVEGAASDTVAIDNSAADGSAVLPEFAAAEPTDPQIFDAASEEAETVGSEFAAPPKRPESISAAVVEYGPPQRPELSRMPANEPAARRHPMNRKSLPRLGRRICKPSLRRAPGVPRPKKANRMKPSHRTQPKSRNQKRSTRSDRRHGQA